MNLISLAERGWIPDAVIRFGIRRLLRNRVADAHRENQDLDAFVEDLKHSPIAVHTADANRQHYEAPAEFFRLVLGPKLKYSCGLYERPGALLSDAEDAMLQLTCERAGIANGQRVLELGCGWGSLTLWMAERFPEAEITAVSNSHRQREFILQRASVRGIRNLRVLTADMVTFEPEGEFDRIVSVEMFEHMRNYEELFKRVAGWLAPGGQAFVHVFCHADEPYLFETDGANNWMGRHFFTGGTMPSDDLFSRFDSDLSITRQWSVNGLHYWRTCEDWLRNLDHMRPAVLEVFQHDMAPKEARLMLQRWRMFFMACAELFRFEDGRRWYVSHYLFEPTRCAEPTPPAACGAAS